MITETLIEFSLAEKKPPTSGKYLVKTRSLMGNIKLVECNVFVSKKNVSFDLSNQTVISWYSNYNPLNVD